MQASPGRIAVAALLAAAVAVPALWFYRGVVPAEPLFRLLLPPLWLVVWTVAAFGAGTDVAAACAGRDRTPIAAVLVLALGAAVLSLAATVLAFAGLLRAPILAGLMLFSVLRGATAWSRARHDLRWPGLSPVGWWLVPVVAAMAVVSATLPAPPVMYDSLHYHLAFPAQWLRAGGLVAFPRHAYASFPASVGALYLYPLALVGPWAAKALHAWFGLLAIAAAGALGHRLGGRHAARWAVLLFAITPSVLELAGYAMVDLAVAAWAGAAMVALLPAHSRRLRPEGRAAIAGICAGAAVGAKYLALATVLAPVVVIAVAVRLLVDRKPLRASRAGAVCAALFLAGIAVAAGPWYLRNAVATGNPVYPFARGVFGGPPVELTTQTMLAQDAARPEGWGARVLHALAAPVVRTFEPLQTASGLGLQWLILLPPAAWLVRSRRAAVLWLGAGAAAAAWAVLLPFGRFLLPALVPAAALAGVGAARITGRKAPPAGRAAVVALLAVVLAWNASTLATRLDLERIATTVGIESEDAFLGRWVSYWPVVEAVRSLPARARILLVGEPRSFYLDRAVEVEDPNRTPLLLELAERVQTVEALQEELVRRGITHVLVNRGEMTWLAGLRGHDDYWWGGSPRGRALVQRLLSERVVRLAGTSRVWLGRLEPSQARPEPRTAPGETAGSRAR